MNYEDIDVEKIVAEVHKAEDDGRLQPTPKHKSMEVRLAALAAIVNKMQNEMHEIVQNEKELVQA